MSCGAKPHPASAPPSFHHLLRLTISFVTIDFSLPWLDSLIPIATHATRHVSIVSDCSGSKLGPWGCSPAAERLTSALLAIFGALHVHLALGRIPILPLWQSLILCFTARRFCFNPHPAEECACEPQRTTRVQVGLLSISIGSQCL
jgi:hypothetical protein